MPHKSVRFPLPARFAGPSSTTGEVGEVTSGVVAPAPVAPFPVAAVRSTTGAPCRPAWTSTTIGTGPATPARDETLGGTSGITTAGLAPTGVRSAPPVSSDRGDR